jgi:hypothetical protein
MYVPYKRDIIDKDEQKTKSQMKIRKKDIARNKGRKRKTNK